MLILQAPNLTALPTIAHGYFGRTGGISSGIYNSLNCGPGSNDDPAHVEENRRRVQTTLGARTLNTVYQIHSPTAVTVNAPWVSPPHADAMVTKTRGVAPRTSFALISAPAFTKASTAS